MSEWVSSITHWFVANREDRGWAKEESYLYYFPLSPELLGAQIFAHFPHRKHPPSAGAAAEWRGGSCSRAIDRGVRQQHQEHFNNPSLSIWAFLLTRLKWEPSFHLRGMSSYDPALFQCSGSSRDQQWAIHPLEVGTCEPPTPVQRQTAAHVRWQRSIPPALLFVRTTSAMAYL